MSENQNNYIINIESIKEIINKLETSSMSNKEALAEFKKASELINEVEDTLKNAKDKIIKYTKLNE